MSKIKQSKRIRLSVSQQLKKQFTYLNGLPPSSSLKRKQQWAEFREALLKRLKRLKGQLHELEKAKAWKRAQTVRDEHLVKKAARQGKKIVAPERLYTREELLKSLSLRINITNLKLFLARSRGLSKESSKVKKLNADLLSLIELKETILHREKYYPGAEHEAEKTSPKGKG